MPTSQGLRGVSGAPLGSRQACAAKTSLDACSLSLPSPRTHGDSLDSSFSRSFGRWLGQQRVCHPRVGWARAGAESGVAVGEAGSVLLEFGV